MIPNIHTGMRLPLLKEGEELTLTDLNQIVAVFNSVLKMEVKRRPATADPIGNVTPTGEVITSNENMVLALYD